MKKILTLIAALFMMGSMMVVQANITIKGKVPAEWTNAINVYVFGTSDAEGFHAATQEGEWWSYTYTGSSEKINAIFVNGSSWTNLPQSSQTVDITDISADACYEVSYNSTGKCTVADADCPSSTPDPGQDPVQDPEPTVTNITIKGKVPAEWTNAINVYVFGTSDAEGFHAATQQGEWWSYTYTGSSEKINAIFVNGSSWTNLPQSSQTVDITEISADACYEVITNGTAKCNVTQVDCPSSTPDPGQDPVQDPEPTVTNITIKGKVPAEWTNAINVYVFGTSDAEGFHAATQEGEWWSYTYTGSSEKINAIFVNGSSWTNLPQSSQTVDITDISADACYEVSYNSTGKCTVADADCPSSTPDPGQDPVQDPEPTVTNITIKGKVPAEWTNAINVYVFGTSDAEGFHTATQQGEWWSYTYTGSSEKINAIFVNGSSWTNLPQSSQTVDITDISADACYEVSYNSTGKCTFAATDCPSTPEPPVVLGVRLYGDFITPGNPMDTEIFTGDDETVSLKMNLLEGNYVFGLVINDVMYVNGTAFTRENPSAEITDGNYDLTLDADVDGEYTFTWTFANNMLSIDYPAAVTPEYATIKFFAPRDQTNKWDHVYAYATKGNKKDFGPKPGTEITEKDAEWYVVTVRKGSNLLFTDNASMETEVIENIQEDACYVSTAINYNVTPKIVSLTKQCNVDYYVAGDAAIMGSWNEAYAPCKLDENNQVIFHDVPVGEYQFKITNGTWAWSLGGNEFLSDEPGCGSIAYTGELGNTCFKIDEVQDVTITYYPATRKICLGALTVKTVGTLTANNIDNLYVDDLAYPSYNTNITDYTAADIALTIVSGDACVEFVEGQIKGTAVGSAVVKIAIAETDLFTGAEANFTVNVTAAPVPPTPSVDWVEVRNGLNIGSYYTLCLEKNITEVNGAIFWNLSYKDAETASMVYLVEETNLEAGKPYIFQATANALNVVLGEASEQSPIANGALRGTFTGINAEDFANLDGSPYLLINDKLCPRTTGNYLSAHRAYVDFSALTVVPAQGFAPGRRVRAIPMQENTATGFENINAADKPMKLMMNGQIYILRGEKMYDATGRIVK